MEGVGDDGDNVMSLPINADALPKDIERNDDGCNEIKIIRKEDEEKGLVESMNVVRSSGTETKSDSNINAAPRSLPHLAPLGIVPERITSDLFLAALKEEGAGIPDPDAIHKSCYDALSAIKEESILDKYVLSDDEAAVLCVIPLLLEPNSGDGSTSLIQKMVESCEKNTPSKLFVLMLMALRKLPRYRGVMYIESETQVGAEIEKKRRKDEIIEYPICTATKEMIPRNEKEDKPTHREVFRVEKGWGYDISDFYLKQDKKVRCEIIHKPDIVLIEPWRVFKVVNSGIYRSKERISIVPLKMKKRRKLIYCPEVPPNVSMHAVSIMRERINDINTVKNMLRVLASHPFDTDFDDRATFKESGGIDCLIDVYKKHNELVKDVVSCLANAIGEENLTFANIEDPDLCKSSSTIILSVFKSVWHKNDFTNFFHDIREFELIIALLTTHNFVDRICSNVLWTLNRLLEYSKFMKIPEVTIKRFYELGIIEVVGTIMKNARDEDLIIACNNMFTRTLENGFDKFVDFNIVKYVNSILVLNPIFSMRINQSERKELRQQELSKRLGSSNEDLTYGDIEAALKGIGVNDTKSVLGSCKEIIVGDKSILNERYILSDEEVILVSTYTYEDENNKAIPPYRIINQKLWKDDIQDQIDDKKSYLRLLLRAIRKLSRTKPKTLYRGIKERVDRSEYDTEKVVLWKGFSSTTTSLNETEDFLTNETTKKMNGTLFEIQDMWGYSISDFSAFPKEQEVLLEPMLKFKVKSIIEDEHLTKVVLEPVKEPEPLSREDSTDKSDHLLFEKSIPPGCIQHIISNLIKYKDSKEECNRICGILREVYIDDGESPDSRRVFKECGGTELLCELFAKYKDSNLIKAFAYVVNSRDRMTNPECIDLIGDTIQEISPKELFDEERVGKLLDDLAAVRKRAVYIGSEEIVRGISVFVNRFIKNRSLCMKALNILCTSGVDRILPI